MPAGRQLGHRPRAAGEGFEEVPHIREWLRPLALEAFGRAGHVVAFEGRAADPSKLLDVCLAMTPDHPDEVAAEGGLPLRTSPWSAAGMPAATEGPDDRIVIAPREGLADVDRRPRTKNRPPDLREHGGDLVIRQIADLEAVPRRHARGGDPGRTPGNGFA